MSRLLPTKHGRDRLGRHVENVRTDLKSWEHAAVRGLKLCGQIHHCSRSSPGSSKLVHVRPSALPCARRGEGTLFPTLPARTLRPMWRDAGVDESVKSKL